MSLSPGQSRKVIVSVRDPDVAGTRPINLTVMRLVSTPIGVIAPVTITTAAARSPIQEVSPPKMQP
ncbi:MAG: hypothetical protein HY650_01715 [Acidobacteria bacterium]|nr:hypothetical protein [Acidobacteriota bacterium]